MAINVSKGVFCIVLSFFVPLFEATFKIRNSKLEIRNKSQNRKFQTPNGDVVRHGAMFAVWNLVFEIC